MDKQTAERVAQMVGGLAVNSGGNVYIVQVTNLNGLEHETLFVGLGGWFVEDRRGNHVAEADGFSVNLRRMGERGGRRDSNSRPPA